jgi:hypothetical protein
MSAICSFFQGIVTALTPSFLQRRSLKALTQKLKSELLGEATDKLLEILLAAMSIAGYLLPEFHRQLRHGEAKLVFRSSTGPVAAAAIIKGGRLSVDSTPKGSGDCLVTFATADAFRRFLFAKDHDILNSLLKNEVTVEGNVNLVYRFGFLANELLFLLDLDLDLG